jgi:signal transduction histidine kinase
MTKIFTLRNKLIWGPISVLIISFVIVGITTVFFQRRSAEQKLIQDVSSVGEILAENIKPAVIFQDNVAMLKLLEGLEEKKFISYAAVIDAEGVVLSEKSFALIPLVRTKEVVKNPVSFVISDEFIYTKKEIADEGSKIATLVMVTTLQPIYYELNQFIQMLALIFLIVLVISFSILYFFQKNISTPILKLTEAAVNISRNKKHTPIAVTRNDELGVLSSVFDKMVTDIVEAKELAEHSKKMKEVFLANMSHEIRTPMNSIIGFTNLINNTELSDKQKEFIKNIKINAANLLVIINDILDISKIESGKVEIEYIDFNLIELIEQLIGTFKFKAAKKGIKFHHSFQRNTPEYLHGDPVRLNQILVNLIGNAIKFTEKGEVKLEILIIEIVKNQVRLKFKVIDTGIGIAAESQSKIFESFAQEGRTITRRFGGTGLGLSISKHLAELLNGTIELESEQGKGSIFTVILPFKLALKLNKLEYISQENRNLQNIKILLVEDNNMNQIVANQLLKKWNAQVKCVFNGIEALEILQKEEFDLILMDLQMPEMDGYEATKNIRKQKKWNKIPIIALTADAFPEIKKQALETGMDEFISKPFNQDELYFKISKLVFNH